MNRKIFTLPLLFFSAISFCQTTTIFKDNFTDNKNEWTIINDSDFNVMIKNHSLILKRNIRIVKEMVVYGIVRKLKILILPKILKYRFMQKSFLMMMFQMVSISNGV